MKFDPKHVMDTECWDNLVLLAASSHVLSIGKKYRKDTP